MSNNGKNPAEGTANEGRQRNNNAGRNNRGNNSNNRKNRQMNVSHNVDMKKYDKMIAAAHDNFSDIPCGKNTEDCGICYKPNDVFGLGACRHPVCAECAIRIRILENSKTCPVCRAEIDILNFCDTRLDFATVALPFPESGHADEHRFGVRFSGDVAGKKYEKYLAHVCKICKPDGDDRMEFTTFAALRQHMANSHEMSYCHICTDNLSLFSRERKAYTRELLQRHIRIGDFDDKSFKGHPQCLYCSQKFLDEENRYKHLRKEHFFCQFCESDGTTTNVFFGKHDELKKHYRERHFACEIDECKQMGIAFASKVELELHKANQHSEKRINLVFEHVRQAPAGRGRQQPSSSSSSGSLSVNQGRISMVKRQGPVNPQSNPEDFIVTPSAQSRNVSLVSGSGRAQFRPDTHDFPSLASSQPPPPPLRSSEFPRLNKVNKTSAPAQQQEEFPALGGSTSAPRVAPIVVKRKVVAQKNAPIQVQPKPSKPPNRINEEENEFFSRRDVPQAVIKVNNTKLRYDMVDDRTPTVAKSNIQMIRREQNKPSSSESSRPPVLNDFPSLPTPLAAITPANIAWVNAKNKKKNGNITGLSVPTNYASKVGQETKKNKKNVPKPVKNEIWSSLGPSSPVRQKEVDEWQTVPLSKEAQVEKEKIERKEERARRKAEAKLGTDLKNEDQDLTKGEDWDRKKAEFQAKMAEASKKQKEQDNSVKEVETKNGNKSNKKKSEKGEKKVEEVSQNETLKTERLEFSSIFNMPSVTSLFSNFSLPSIWGGATNLTPENSPIGPPPGLENSSVNPPPGLETISFQAAPMFSRVDARKKEEVETQPDDGWKRVNGAKAGNKKNKKK